MIATHTITPKALTFHGRSHMHHTVMSTTQSAAAQRKRVSYDENPQVMLPFFLSALLRPIPQAYHIHGEPGYLL